MPVTGYAEDQEAYRAVFDAQYYYSKYPDLQETIGNDAEIQENTDSEEAEKAEKSEEEPEDPNAQNAGPEGDNPENEGEAGEGKIGDFQESDMNNDADL